jgi:outer membrane biosynthesis protein TonB
VARSSFEPGARTGCGYSYYRRQPEPLKAPEAPPSASFRPEGSTCPAELGQWAFMPRLEFPPEFLRRGIEGWAAIRYDLAPWGATGNLAVLAAEPAEAFGAQAMRIVSQARRAPSSGYSGCVTRVRFVLPPRGAPATEGSQTTSN